MRKMASQRGAVLLVNGFYPKLHVLMCRGILVLRLPQLPSPLVQGPFNGTVLHQPGSVYARDDRRSSLFPPRNHVAPRSIPLSHGYDHLSLCTEFPQTRIRHKIE